LGEIFIFDERLIVFLGMDLGEEEILNEANLVFDVLAREGLKGWWGRNARQ
jgi:hypothetical protein